MSPALDRTYSTRDVVRRCRVTVRQLQLWRDQRLLRPVFEGHACVYSEHQLRNARLIRDLLSKGLRYDAIRRLLPRLAQYDRGYLLIHGNRRKTQYAATEEDVFKFALQADDVLLLDLGAAL